MANRRMFSKSITNSSAFLMMPMSSQALYMHLGMNADDDGYCEYFGIMRMCGANIDDMKVLQAKNFVQVFDDKVLIIRDWTENNYIQKDRYQPSKYLGTYPIDTPCIQNVYKMDTQDRIGKDRIGNINTESSHPKDEKGQKHNLDGITEEMCQSIADQYNVRLSDVTDMLEDLKLYCSSKNKRFSNYYATLQVWVRRSLKDGKMHRKPVEQVYHEEPESMASPEKIARLSEIRESLNAKLGL